MERRGTWVLFWGSCAWSDCVTERTFSFVMKWTKTKFIKSLFECVNNLRYHCITSESAIGATTCSYLRVTTWGIELTNDLNELMCASTVDVAPAIALWSALSITALTFMTTLKMTIVEQTILKWTDGHGTAVLRTDSRTRNVPVGNTGHYSGNSGFPFSANRKFQTFWKFWFSVLGKPGKPEILDVF